MIRIPPNQGPRTVNGHDTPHLARLGNSLARNLLLDIHIIAHSAINFLVLQKVVGNRLLRRHAPRILRRGLEHPVPSSRPIEVSWPIIA